MSGFTCWGDVYSSPGFVADQDEMRLPLNVLKAVSALRPEEQGEIPSFELFGEPFASPPRLDLVGTFYAPIPGLVIFYAEKASGSDPHCWNMCALIKRTADDPKHRLLVGEFDTRYHDDQHLRIMRLVPDEQTIAQLLMGRGHKFAVDLAFNQHHHVHRHILAIPSEQWDRLTTWLDVHLPERE